MQVRFQKYPTICKVCDWSYVTHGEKNPWNFVNI